MRILLFNEYFPPDTSATAKMAAEVAAALAARHDVTVLAGRPSYDPTARYPFALFRRERRGNFTVEIVGSTDFPRHRMRHRVANYLSYLAFAVPRAVALRSDIVVSMTDPPMAGIAAAFAAKLMRRPFAYNIRDLYPDMALGGAIIRPGPMARLWERLHGWALRRASLVIVLGEDMRERILAKGVPANRVVVVRDAALRPARIAAIEEPATQQIRCGFPFVVIHAGNLGFYGAWETLVRAAKLIQADSTAMVFVGSGSNAPQVAELARGCPNIRLLPFRPAAEIPNVMAAGDLHIVTVKRGLEGVIVPSKFYGLLAYGRPVLAVAPEACEFTRIVRETGCGVAVEPEDAEGLARVIRELRAQPERRLEMARRALVASARFDREAEMRRFVDFVEQASDPLFGSAPAHSRPEAQARTFHQPEQNAGREICRKEAR